MVKNGPSLDMDEGTASQSPKKENMHPDGGEGKSQGGVRESKNIDWSVRRGRLLGS